MQDKGNTWPLSIVGAHRSLSIGDIEGFDLPPLSVITGLNGSGKTQLLEAIAGESVAVFPDSGLASGDILFVRSQELALSASNPPSLDEMTSNFLDQIASLRTQGITTNGLEGDALAEFVKDSLAGRMVHDFRGALTLQALVAMEAKAGKPILEFDRVDARRYVPAHGWPMLPFENTTTAVGVAWVTRYRENLFERFLAHEGEEANPLTDDEFRTALGGPPWEGLNSALERIGLPFRVPEIPVLPLSVPIDYPAYLQDPAGNRLRPEELSGGERVLGALALFIYNLKLASERLHAPKLLLLDEPDSLLHPSMVGAMLEVLHELVVEELKGRVILTTHSPTTVALAPEGSVFTMTREAPRLHSATRDAALSVLTVGVPTLSVKIENRRQVFVEALDDQKIYTRLWESLQSVIGSPRTLEFLAVGNGSDGGGCDAVIRLVDSLRSRGVDTVFGLLDRDVRKIQPSEHVHLLKDCYSIENLIADPLLVGLLLLRDRKVPSGELGLSPNSGHLDVDTHEKRQAVASAVATKVFAEDSLVGRLHLNGETLSIPERYLNVSGHVLVGDAQPGLLQEAWPALKAYTHGGLLWTIVNTVIPDHIGCVPAAGLQAFEGLLAD